MRGHVFADGFAENILPQKTFEHAKKRLALLVGDVVKCAVRFGFRRDRLLDRMRGRSGITFHRDFLRDAGAPRWISRQTVLQPDFPLRIEPRGAFGSHPRSETFVQPKIVPPSHRDEIAKPHVCHLVSEHFVNALLGFEGRILWIEQKDRLVISDPAPILHRAAESTGQCNLIELRQRVGNAEVVVVVLQDLRGRFERVAAHLPFAFRRDHADLGRTAF